MARLNLNGTWMLSNEGSRKEIRSIPMHIPGDNYSALTDAGIIPDPYYGFNEQQAQWIGKEDWTVSRTFVYKKNPGEKAYLCMDRADTYFTVFLNGREAARGDNYFRIWRFDVTDFLADGENTAEIRFESAERHAQEFADRLPYTIPFSQYDVFSPHRNLSRKIQCHAGWDWGPCLMVSGIYGDISIQTVRKGYIQSVCVNTVPEKENGLTGTWDARITVRYHAESSGSRLFRMELSFPEGSIVKTVQKDVTAGENEFSQTIQVKSPVLWKSADELMEEGRACNTLYALQVTAAADGTEESSVTKEIGFRTLTLRAEKDADGCSLYYELNGRQIFAKGANWIPQDALPSRWTQDRLRYLLQSAVDANMNSIRVWGGGQYESDMFYTLCDRMGIIVWQDCMFACSLYPSTPEFLAGVEKELEDNVYRLQSHPSLAVWCGNNENLGALTWYEESRKSRDRYLADYDRLNHGTVEKTIRRCDPERTWWPSSPCAGPDTFGDNWHNDSEGDMHFWSVWHGKEDWEAFLAIRPRFVSEFGYESFPSLEGVKEYAAHEHMNLTDPVMEYHQRSPSGNSIILENFSRYFRFPQGTQNILYLSQVQQALAIKTAVQYWRSTRPHCMGATYWQLNDVWPVASWSSIEYSGKWKLLHYAAKRFFAPVAFSIFKKDGILYASAVNDTRQDKDMTVTLEFIDFSGKVIAPQVTVHTVLKSDSAMYVWQSSEKDLPDGTDTYFVHGTLTGADRSVTDTFFLSRWKRCDLQQAHIMAEVQDAAGEMTVRLSTDRPAFYVCLEAEGIRGQFSDNMLTLLPEKPVSVSFRQSSYGFTDSGEKKLSAEDLRRALHIRSLRDTYE